MWPIVLMGQTYVFHDQKPYSSEREVNTLNRQVRAIADSLVKRDNNQVERVNIFEVDTSKYVLVEGRNDVFRLEEDGFTNISNSSFHGQNFRCKQFVWNDTLYSYGGYGFWEHHGDLIYFDWTRREWEIQPVPDVFDGMMRWKTFVRDSLLFSFGGKKWEQGTDQLDIDSHLREINLEMSQSKTRGSIHRTLSNLPYPNAFFETEHYLLILNSEGLSVFIAKEDLAFKSTQLTFLRELIYSQSPALYQIAGDKIKVFDREGPMTDAVHLDKAYASLEGEAVPIVAEKQWSWSKVSIGVLAVIILGVLVYYRRRRRTRKRTFEHPLIEKLEEHSGQTLKIEQLDEIFDISEIRQNETKRAKRANYIKEINLEYESRVGKKFIHRERDPEDKRRFVYRIERK